MPLLKTMLLSLLVGASAVANTLTQPITGTCGFYSGTPSNVVYSQTFSGDGTFCTGFMSGGSFTESGPLLSAGDSGASAHNTMSGTAPAGFYLFVNIQDTDTVTQQYLVQATNPSPTHTGTLTIDLSEHSDEDGTGAGLCSETGSITTPGYTLGTGPPVTIPVTFGQTLTFTQTAQISCSYSSPGAGVGFGEDGMFTASPVTLLYDANGNLLGTLTSSGTVVPEPGFVVPMLMLAGLGWAQRRRRGRVVNCNPGS